MTPQHMLLQIKLRLLNRSTGSVLVYAQLAAVTAVESMSKPTGVVGCILYTPCRNRHTPWPVHHVLMSQTQRVVRLSACFPSGLQVLVPLCSVLHDRQQETGCSQSYFIFKQHFSHPECCQHTE